MPGPADGENAPLCEIHVLNGVESMRIEPLTISTTGATYFIPRETKIRHTVPSGTSAILDRKISVGRITHVKN